MHHTASVQASGVSKPRLLLRRFKGRNEGCPPAVNRGLACRNRRQSLMGYCLLMLTCTQPSSLASLSARQSRATTYSGSSSCNAPIILRRQIIPCSAYSAEQSGHDCSQRGKPRICRVWSAHECAPARRLAVQPRPASSPRLGYPMT